MSLNFANNNSLSAITTKPSGLSGGSMNLISTQTASSSSTISFTSGIDSTYDEYVFKFYDIHPSQDASSFFSFNMSVDGGSNYNVAKTTTDFLSYHKEDGSDQGLYYETGYDLANGTGFQTISDNAGADNDQSCAGELILYKPSSTTFVKHFIAKTNIAQTSDYCTTFYTAGYGNTTSAVDAVRFQMTAGNFDGVIKLYGIS